MFLTTNLEYWGLTASSQKTTFQTFIKRITEVYLQRDATLSEIGSCVRPMNNTTFQTFIKRITEEYLQRDATLSEIGSYVRPMNKMALDNLWLSIHVDTNYLDLKVLLSFCCYCVDVIRFSLSLRLQPTEFPYATCVVVLYLCYPRSIVDDELSLFSFN